jgi:hypothetical protein
LLLDTITLPPLDLALSDITFDWVFFFMPVSQYECEIRGIFVLVHSCISRSSKWVWLMMALRKHCWLKGSFDSSSYFLSLRVNASGVHCHPSHLQPPIGLCFWLLHTLSIVSKMLVAATRPVAKASKHEDAWPRFIAPTMTLRKIWNKKRDTVGWGCIVQWLSVFLACTKPCPVPQKKKKKKKRERERDSVQAFCQLVNNAPYHLGHSGELRDFS